MISYRQSDLMDAMRKPAKIEFHFTLWGDALCYNGPVFESLAEGKEITPTEIRVTKFVEDVVIACGGVQMSGYKKIPVPTAPFGGREVMDHIVTEIKKDKDILLVHLREETISKFELDVVANK